MSQSSALLTVRNLSKQFVVDRSILGRGTTSVRAVDAVSFDIAAGETLALVGESGCGKSTVGRLVLRLIEPSAGTVVFDNRELSKLSQTDLRKFRANAQLIFQDPYASLNPRMTVAATLAEPFMLHTDLTAGDRRGRVTELLATVGLKPEHAARYPHEFSGGQRQRIAIARALATGPKLIVCDEPVSALDVSIRAQILNLLKDLQQRLGLAYLFISHDLGVVRHIGTRVAVMYLGRIVETGTTADVFAEPRHPYTQALLSAIPLPQPTRGATRVLMAGDPPSPLSPPSGCHLHPRCQHAAEPCRTTVPVLTREPDGHATACHFWRNIEGRSAIPVDTAWPPHLKKLVAAFDRPPIAGPLTT